MSRYVYRTADDVVPRIVPSGEQNLVQLGAVCANCEPSGSYRRPVSFAVPVRIPQIYPVYPVRTPLVNWGATATVQQPPPSSGVTAVVSNPGALPVSPQPSPTVSVPPSQTAPSLTQPGTVINGSGASATVAPEVGSVSAWLSESNLIAGLPNWGIAAVALVGAFLFFSPASGRRR